MTRDMKLAESLPAQLMGDKMLAHHRRWAQAKRLTAMYRPMLGVQNLHAHPRADSSSCGAAALGCSKHFIQIVHKTETFPGFINLV